MQLLDGLYAKGMSPLQQLQKSNTQSPDIQSLSLDDLFFLSPNEKLRRSVPLSSYKLVGNP